MTTIPEKAVKKTSTALETLAEDTVLLFTPNRAQRAIRARFWSVIGASIGHKDPFSMTAMEIARLVKDNRILNWIGQPGFKDWFMNNTEHIERLEYLFDLALTAAEDVLLSTDPKTMTAKVQMVRVVAELARKMPSRNQEQFADERIAKMSKEELEQFLAEQGVNVRHETVLSVPAKSADSKDEDIDPIIEIVDEELSPNALGGKP